LKKVLIGLATADVLVLGATAVVGWMAQGGRLFALHFPLGLFGAIYTVFMHMVVYIYFIVCGKIVGEAVERAGLDQELAARSMRLKLVTFRFALLAMGAAILTAILGARIAAVSVGADGQADAQRHEAAVMLHMVVALATLVLQPIVATVEYHNIEAQMALSAEALAGLEASREARRTADTSAARNGVDRAG
jgi:hypothetical protein